MYVTDGDGSEKTKGTSTDGGFKSERAKEKIDKRESESVSVRRERARQKKRERESESESERD